MPVIAGGLRRTVEACARRRASLIVAAAIAAVGVGLSPVSALATTTANIYAVPSGGAGSGNYPSVCTQADPCSFFWALDQAVTSSNVNGDAAIVNLAAGTYTGARYIESTGGLPASLELLGEGAGPSATVLDGDGAQTLLVNGVNYGVTIKNLMLEDGSSGGFDTYGANLLADTSGPGVTLDDDVVTGGTSGSGGQADVTGGTLTIDNSTVENSGTVTGGTEEQQTGTLNVNDSTFSGNTFAAVWSSGTGSVSVANSTLVGNYAGVGDDGTGDFLVDASTIAGNSDGGLSGGDGTLDVGDSVLASNVADCSLDGGSIDDAGYNVMDDSSCGFSTADGSKQFTTSQIGLLALAKNGGPTETERITSSSRAYDFAPDSFLSCAGNDQRGIPYVQAGKTVCDAGAYQVAPPTLSAVTPAGAEPGSTIQLTGTNLLYAIAAFGPGNVSASVTSPSLTSLTLGMPVLAIGSQPITVTNADGSATVAFSSDGPSISGTLPAAEVDHPYSQAIGATGGELPETFSLASGTLPAGLALSSVGTVSGTPTAATAANFTIKDTDSDGVSSTAVVSLSVLAPTITVGSSKVKFKRLKAGIDLTCETAACSGEVSITKTIHVKVTKHHKTKTKSKTIVLASGSYSLTAGQPGEVTITLTRTGHRDLATAAHHAQHENVSATVLGGNTVTTKVKVT